jgi:ribosomal-protein-alanine N-acetyltransferase
MNTERLVLSAITESDTDAIFELFSKEIVIKYYDLHVFEEPKQAKKLIELFESRFNAGQGIRWAIREKDSDILIGTCGFNSWISPMKSAVIGYDLNPNFWGMGYAKEAVGQILQAAFTGLLPCGPIHRVQADTVPGNEQSERLLLALGFQHEGLRRECGFWKKKFHDLNCFGLLSHEQSKT